MNINLTLIGQTIIFAAFVWFCMKFIWPPIVEAMAARTKQIADGLAAAEKGHKAKELAQIEADKLVAESRAQATEIINQANARGSEMINEAKDKAANEAKSVTDKAASNIVAELNSARENLRKEVSNLVLKGVRQIVAREVTEADHKEVLSSLSERL